VPQGEQRGRLRSIPGSPPSLVDVPGGCRFAPRCRLATSDCLTWETELLQASGPGQLARCWRHHEAERTREWQASDSA
jgi:peptide/nickel transport system ATP-binding protein